MTIAPSATDVAKAVVTLLTDHAGDLPEAFTLSRQYVPTRKVSDEGIEVVVVGGRFNLDRLDRSSLQSELPIMVVISKKLDDAADVTTADVVIDFAEELGVLLFDHPSPIAGVELDNIESADPTPDHERLLKHKICYVYLLCNYERREL